MSGTPASVAGPSSRSASTDDDGPMTTSTPFATRSANDSSAFCVLASPESRLSTSTGTPPTPPAALISRIAALTPATWAGPMNATPPLDGKSVPIRSTPSPIGVGDGLDGVGVGMGAVVQAVVIAATARSAATRRARTKARGIRGSFRSVCRDPIGCSDGDDGGAAAGSRAR